MSFHMTGIGWWERAVYDRDTWFTAQASCSEWSSIQQVQESSNGMFLTFIIIIIIIYSAFHKKYNNVNISKQTLRECQL